MDKEEIIVIAVLLSLLIVGIFYIGFVGLIPLSLTGYTTLSLDKADFMSRTAWFNEPTWILTVAQGGMGQHAIGTMDKEDVERKSGTEPETDLLIDITYSEQFCEYAIKPDYAKINIFKLDLKEWSCLGYVTDEDKKKCPDYVVIDNYWHEPFTCFCIYMVPQVSVMGNIETPYVRTISEIAVEAKGERYSETFDTVGKIEGFIGDNAYVIWDGYLVKDVCQDKDPYHTFYRNGAWVVGRADEYDTWKSVYFGARSNLESADRGRIESAINDVNYVSDRALSSVWFGTIERPAEIYNSVIGIDLPIFVSVPIWTFFIKASWLGIYQPTPDFEIVSATSGVFKTGADGYISTVIRNKGDERGTFNSYAVCTEPFRFVGTTISDSLMPLEEKSYSLRISAETDRPITGTCTVYVEWLGKSIFRNVEVSCDPHLMCEPSRYYCEFNKVYQCNPYGSDKVFVEDCDPDKTCTIDSTGTGYCKVGGGRGEDVCDYACGMFDFGCKMNEFFCRMSAGAGALIEGIISFFVTVFAWLGLFAVIGVVIYLTLRRYIKI